MSVTMEAVHEYIQNNKQGELYLKFAPTRTVYTESIKVPKHMIDTALLLLD